jgi:hypothetical protein
MKINKHKSYLVFEDEREGISNFATYLERIISEKYDEHNLVIDLLKYNQLNLPQLLLFLRISNYHRATKHSFVLVNDAISIDDIPDEMIVVPTLEEAGDVIEMEDIERDLGF